MPEFLAVQGVRAVMVFAGLPTKAQRLNFPISPLIIAVRGLTSVQK